MERERDNILKSMLLSGIEWELKDNVQTKVDSQKFQIPNSIRPVSNDDILEIANMAAANPSIIDAILSFKDHPLSKVAKNTIMPKLCNSPAPLLVITDIPSLSDDNKGEILTGIDGELFDKMISAIGFSREQIAITPLVFWRPAGGRTITDEELNFCKPFIDRIISELKPMKILTLGAVAAKIIAGASLPKDHGKVFGNIIPIYKPDFILQNPNVKKDVWEALKQVGAKVMSYIIALLNIAELAIDTIVI